MFSYLFPEKKVQPLSRFEKTAECKEIAILLEALRKKQNELAKDLMKKSGDQSLDFKKHTVLDNLLSDLDTAISHYNTLPVPVIRDNLLREVHTLVATLSDKVKTTLLTHGPLLGEFRDNNKVWVQGVVGGSYVFGAISALYAAPLGILTKIGLYYAGDYTVSKIGSKLGLNETKAKSFIFLAQLHTLLLSKKKHLEHILGIHDPAAPEAIGAIVADTIEQLEVSASEEDASNEERHGADISGLLFTLSPITQSYVDGVKHNPSISTTLEDLALTQAEKSQFGAFEEPIYLSVCDIPVKVNGTLYDLNSLTQLPPDEDGQYEEPVSRLKFYPRDIQPAREEYNAIRTLIETIKRERENQSAPAVRLSR